MRAMRAARLVEPRAPLCLQEVPVPEPGPGEVLVRVEACGLCGTDLHLAVEGSLPVAHTPITLGHEAAGVVAASGSGVKHVRDGDRVAVFPATACGSCGHCHRGRESLCDASEVLGMGRDGALADYVVVPATALVALPSGIAFDVGAVATDGIATPFHALRERGRLRAGEVVGIFGCGGLGTHAIQLARMMGAGFIVAVDTDPRARSRAQVLGADLTVDPVAVDVRGVIEDATGGRLDLALECVGRRETVELAARCLDKGGRVVVIGVGPQCPRLPPIAAFVGREQAILGSFGMDRTDIEDLYTLIAAGRLDVSASVSARYSLERANAALQHLARKEDGVVRVVVQPGLTIQGG